MKTLITVLGILGIALTMSSCASPARPIDLCNAPSRVEERFWLRMDARSIVVGITIPLTKREGGKSWE